MSARPFLLALLLAAAPAAAARPPSRQEAPPAVAPPDAPDARGPLRADVRVLVTTEGRFAAFGEPAACAAGHVVFHARLDGGGDAIAGTSGGAVTVVVETHQEIVARGKRGTIARLGTRPTVDDRFYVAFTTEFDAGGRAVLLARGFDGGNCALVADSTESFRDFGELAAIGGGGEVAFHATIDPPGHPDRVAGGRGSFEPEARRQGDSLDPPTRVTHDGRVKRLENGLFLDRGDALVTVARTTGAASEALDVEDGFGLADGGALAWRGAPRVGRWAVYVRTGGTPRIVATSDDTRVAFGVPAVDVRGRVAFSATRSDGDAELLVAPPGGRAEPQLAAGSGYVAIGDSVALDDGGGHVAFVGRRADGSQRLVLTGDARAPDGLVTLLATGDPVGARRIASLRLGARAFLRSDRLAVQLAFDDGVEAIALLHLTR